MNKLQTVELIINWVAADDWSVGKRDRKTIAEFVSANWQPDPVKEEVQVWQKYFVQTWVKGRLERKTHCEYWDGKSPQLMDSFKFDLLNINGLHLLPPAEASAWLAAHPLPVKSDGDMPARKDGTSVASSDVTVSPSSPDPRDAEIEQLKVRVQEWSRTATERNDEIERLKKDIARVVDEAQKRGAVDANLHGIKDVKIEDQAKQIERLKWQLLDCDGVVARLEKLNSELRTTHTSQLAEILKRVRSAQGQFPISAIGDAGQHTLNLLVDYIRTLLPKPKRPMEVIIADIIAGLDRYYANDGKMETLAEIDPLMAERAELLKGGG